MEQSPHGIPLLFGYDVIHGYRTIFPVPLGEAASFDLETIELSARIAGREVAAAGLHWTFAPMVDIARDPRWGRVVEGAGEDPYYGSLVAAARVRGFQGRGQLAAADTVLACAKHFAAYGGVLGGREYNSVDVSERALRSIHLPPFRAAVQAGVGSFMSAFTDISGIPATAHRGLLTDVLRGEWAFSGMVISDWSSVDELRVHRVAADKREAARLAIVAGLDMEMVSSAYQDELEGLIADGAVSAALVDQAVIRILMTKDKLGLFDDPFRYHDESRERAALLTSEQRAAARKAARRSFVLLKNEGNVLPIAPSVRTVALVGALSDAPYDMLGSWHAQGRQQDVVSVRAGMEARARQASIELEYVPGVAVPGGALPDSVQAARNAAVAAARRSDLVIAVLGENGYMSGEDQSRTRLSMSPPQRALLRALQGTGKPIALVVISCTHSGMGSPTRSSNTAPSPRMHRRRLSSGLR